MASNYLARILCKVQHLLSDSKPAAIRVHLRLPACKFSCVKGGQARSLLKKESRTELSHYLQMLSATGWCKKSFFASFVTEDPIAFVKQRSTTHCVLTRMMPLSYHRILGVSVWYRLTIFWSVSMGSETIPAYKG